MRDFWNQLSGHGHRIRPLFSRAFTLTAIQRKNLEASKKLNLITRHISNQSENLLTTVSIHFIAILSNVTMW